MVKDERSGESAIRYQPKRRMTLLERWGYDNGVHADKDQAQSGAIMHVQYAASPLLRSLLAGAILSALCLCCDGANAQAVAAGAEALGLESPSAATNDSGPVGVIALTQGLNASLLTATQHDSSNGWSTIFTPDVSYRFNRHFSLSASTPIYAYINIEQAKGPKAKPIYSQTTQQGVPGDTALLAQIDISGLVDYTADISLGVPTGNSKYGLGAGQATYDFNNHFDKSVSIFTPDIELGFGDSSSLIAQRIRKDYTAVGKLAHFQAGTSVDLPHSISFEADAYEQLPLSASTLYSTTRKGKKRIRTVTSQGPTEDNGFLTSLDLPVSSHFTLSGYYNRSLRDHDDIAGISLTAFLRPVARLAVAP